MYMDSFKIHVISTYSWDTSYELVQLQVNELYINILVSWTYSWYKSYALIHQVMYTSHEHTRHKATMYTSHELICHEPQCIHVWTHSYAFAYELIHIHLCEDCIWTHSRYLSYHLIHIQLTSWILSYQLFHSKRALSKRLYSAKETYNFKEPHQDTCHINSFIYASSGLSVQS